MHRSFPGSAYGFTIRGVALLCKLPMTLLAIRPWYKCGHLVQYRTYIVPPLDWYVNLLHGNRTPLNCKNTWHTTVSGLLSCSRRSCPITPFRRPRRQNQHDLELCLFQLQTAPFSSYPEHIEMLVDLFQKSSPKYL